MAYVLHSSPSDKVPGNLELARSTQRMWKCVKFLTSILHSLRDPASVRLLCVAHHEFDILTNPPKKDENWGMILRSQSDSIFHKSFPLGVLFRKLLSNSGTMDHFLKEPGNSPWVSNQTMKTILAEFFDVVLQSIQTKLPLNKDESYHWWPPQPQCAKIHQQ